MRAWILAALTALVLHAAILLFGGVFFLKPEETAATQIEEIDLMTAEEAEQEAEETVEPTEPEQIEVAREAPPEMPEEVLEAAPEIAPTDVVARLDALSLSALVGALDPGAGGDGFGGGAASLASGGRIGGTGAPGTVAGFSETASDALFDLGALDQTPRLLHQPAPVYPAELRKQKIEGTVYVVFVVDKDGRVQRPSVESSPNDAFRAPALAAVQRWKFEPATVRGEKVRTRMRVPIRFALNG